MESILDRISIELLKCNIPLHESRGVNKSFLPLIENIWSMIMNEDALSIGDYHIIPLENIFVENDIIEHFKMITVEWGGSEEKKIRSAFFSFQEDLKINENNKLINVQLHISLKELAKSQFKIEMMHELNHVLRNYFFLTKDIKTQDSEKDRISLLSTLEVGDIDTISSKIKFNFYCSDKDEINARASELYSVIYDNNEINRTNFDKYIQNTNMILVQKSLRNMLAILSLELTESVKEMLGELIKRNVESCYSELSNLNTFKIYRKRLVNALAYAEHQAYKVIEQALYDVENDFADRKKQNYLQKEMTMLGDNGSDDVKRILEGIQKCENIRKLIKKLQ